MHACSVLAAGCVCVVLYYMYMLVACIGKIWTYRSRVNQLPGPPLLPVIGNCHQLPLPLDGRFFKFLLEQTRKYNKCFHLQISPLTATVFLTHPDTVKAVLKEHEPKDFQYGGGYSPLVPWLGDGLLLSRGEKWHRNRKLLTPAFHFDILKNYMMVYNECAEILLDKWCTHADTGVSFNLYNDISLCTLNVIMRCAFSYSEDIQNQGVLHPYVAAVYKIAEITTNQIFMPWKQIHSIYRWSGEYRILRGHIDFVHHFADQVIAKRKAALKNPEHKQAGSGGRLDFLDILLSARDSDGNGLSDGDIRDETDTFMFEGHDTTASGISWVLYALAKHPEEQQRAYEEVQLLLTGRTCNDVLWDDMNELPYLTRVIKESFRMYSPVPGVTRNLTKPMVIEGVELLPGTTLIPQFYCLHHNPTVWGEDHDVFRPDRFLPENINHMDPYAFCPFAAGPRNCIGQNFAMNETKTLIAKVLYRYELELDPDAPNTEPMPHLVTRPTNGIQVLLRRR